ncbi:MAG: signal peptidase I, partial [Candidatus Ancillula sp.]|nr:signal peptidase I [Candidatus Ancillula sp.]
HTRAVKHTFLKDAVFVIVASVVLSTLMKAFLFMPFIIPSGSMENTLQVEDRILTYRLKPHPFALDRGDVVVFKDNREWMDPNNDGHQDDGDTPIQKALKFIGFMPEDDDSYLVKRVIGLPGDHVACKGTGYPVTVNGKAIDESSYIKKGSDPSSMPFDVIVPDNSLWVMGDNRNNSADSRYHQGLPTKGFVSEDDVVGDVFLIFWPSQRAQRIADVKEVFKDVPASDESSKNDADSTTLSGDLSDDSDGTSVQIGG